MKKLFIGCAVVVAALLGLATYVVYQLKPALEELEAAWTLAFERMEQLDAAHPFAVDGARAGPLDDARFARSLDLRASFAGYLDQVGEAFRDASHPPGDGGDEEDDDMGVLEQVLGLFEIATPLMDALTDRLEEQRMGPTEFAHHSRVLWASLRRLDAGLGDAALNPLRGYYNRLEEAYERARRGREDVMSLDDAIGEVDAAAMDVAEAVMLADVGRVQAGLPAVEVEPLYMSLDDIRDPEQMQRIAFPHEMHEPVPREGAPEDP